MATSKIAIDVEVKAEGGAKSLKDLKGELKALQSQISQTKEGSEEYLAVLRQIGDTKDQIDDLNDSIAATTGAGKFQAIANVGAKIAAGFQLASSTMAMFGTESAEVEKALQKAQAAMTFVQGLKELEGIGEAFKNVKTVILDFGKQAIAAMQKLWAVMVANPVMAVIAGVAALAAVTYTLIEATDEDTEANKKNNISLEERNKLLEEAKRKMDEVIDSSQGHITRQMEQIKLQEKLKDLDAAGADANEIKKVRLQLLQSELTDLKVYLSSQQGNLKAQDELAIKEKIYRKEREIARLDIVKAQKEDIKLKNEENEAIHINKNLLEEIQTLKQNDIEIQKNSNELKEKSKNLEAFATNEQIKALENLVSFRKRKGEESYNEELNLAQARLDLVLNNEQSSYNDRLKAQEDYNKEVERLDKEKAERQQAIRDAEVQLTYDSLKLIGDIATNFAKQDEASQRKAFEINKKVQLALATIDMIKGVQSAFTSAQASPFTAVFPGYPYVQAAMAAAYGIMNIRKIQQTQFQGGAAGGMEGAAGATGGAVSAPIQGGVNNTSTMLENMGQGQQEQKPIKAYVLQTDVASEDQKIKAIENKSKIE